MEKVYQPQAVVIVPAFPMMNWTTKNDHHYVNEELITDTEFSRDPKTPVAESFVPNLVKGTADTAPMLIDLSLLRGSVKGIMDAINKAVLEGKTRYVCDAETNDDLQVIAHVFASLDKKMFGPDPAAWQSTWRMP